jgi:heme-degrading monooxygenase HmoA
MTQRSGYPRGRRRHEHADFVMIVRAWRGYAAAANAEAYPRHLLQTVRPKLEQLSGFRGLYLLRRSGPTEVGYQVLTLWDSMEAVTAFAGTTPDRAVVEPEAQAALVRYDAVVQHYVVVAGPG